MATGFTYPYNIQNLPNPGSVYTGVTGSDYTGPQAPTGGNWAVWSLFTNSITSAGATGYTGNVGTALVKGNMTINGYMAGAPISINQTIASNKLILPTGATTLPTISASDKLIFATGTNSSYNVSIGNTGTVMYQSVPTNGTLTTFIGGTGMTSVATTALTIGIGATGSVSIGNGATANSTTVSIGVNAGISSATGTINSVFLGTNAAGYTGGAANDIAIGTNAGYQNDMVFSLQNLPQTALPTSGFLNATTSGSSTIILPQYNTTTYYTSTSIGGGGQTFRATVTGLTNLFTTVYSNTTGTTYFALSTTTPFYSINSGASWQQVNSAPSAPAFSAGVSSSLGIILYVTGSLAGIAGQTTNVTGSVYIAQTTTSWTFTQLTQVTNNLPANTGYYTACAVSGTGTIAIVSYAASITPPTSASLYFSNTIATSIPTFTTFSVANVWTSVAINTAGTAMIAGTTTGQVYTTNSASVLTSTTPLTLASQTGAQVISVAISPTGQLMAAATTAIVYVSYNYGATFTGIQLAFTIVSISLSSTQLLVIQAGTTPFVYYTLSSSPNTVAIGNVAGNVNQGANTIAIGVNSGLTAQGVNAISVGVNAGQTNVSASAISLGYQTNMENDGIIYGNATTTSVFSYTASYLVVGGGGGGGGDQAGGGGAGGVISGTATFVSGTTLSVTVGTGGTAGNGYPSNSQGGNGTNSILGSLIAYGGGGGGSSDTAGVQNGLNGGSGGGSATNSSVGTAIGIGIVGQGNNGGNAATDNATYRNGGGGGGAGAVGQTGVGSSGASNVSGSGGIGVVTSIITSDIATTTNVGQVVGSLVYVGGGGGGGIAAAGGTPGTGGNGGGGNGGTLNTGSLGSSGKANTGGGGGGGGGYTPNPNNGGAGGSGVVILSIPTSIYSGIQTGATVTINGSNTVLIWKSGTGSYTFSTPPYAPVISTNGQTIFLPSGMNTYYLSSNGGTSFSTPITVSVATTIGFALSGNYQGTPLYILLSGSSVTSPVCYGVSTTFTKNESLFPIGSFSAAANSTFNNILICTTAGKVYGTYNAAPLSSPSFVLMANGSIFSGTFSYAQTAMSSTYLSSGGVAVLTPYTVSGPSALWYSSNAHLSTGTVSYGTGVVFSALTTANGIPSLTVAAGPTNYWNAVAVSGTGQYILAAIYGGGVYLSTNGSSGSTLVTFTAISSVLGLTGFWTGASMSISGQVMVLGSFTNAIYVSYSYGATWLVLASVSAGVGTFPIVSGDASRLIVLNTTTGTLYVYSLSASASASTVAIGTNAGFINQGGSSVAVGYNAGSTYQGATSVAIGQNAAQNAQGVGAIAIGQSAGASAQLGNAIAVGYSAGVNGQGSGAIAMGYQAGIGPVGTNSIAIGAVTSVTSTGFTGTQASGAISIGANIGTLSQATNAIQVGQNIGIVSTLTSITSVSTSTTLRWIFTNFNVTPTSFVISENANYQGLVSSGTLYLTFNENSNTPIWYQANVPTVRSVSISNNGATMIAYGTVSIYISTNYGVSFTTVSVTATPVSGAIGGWNGNIPYNAVCSTKVGPLQYQLVIAYASTTTNYIYLSTNGSSVSLVTFCRIDGTSTLPVATSNYTPAAQCMAMSGSGQYAIIALSATNQLSSNLYWSSNVSSSSPPSVLPTWFPLTTVGGNISGIPYYSSLSTVNVALWSTVAMSQNGQYILVALGGTSTAIAPVYLSSNGNTITPPTFTMVTGLPYGIWNSFTISQTGQYMYAYGYSIPSSLYQTPGWLSNIGTNVGQNNTFTWTVPVACYLNTINFYLYFISTQLNIYFTWTKAAGGTTTIGPIGIQGTEQGFPSGMYSLSSIGNWVFGSSALPSGVIAYSNAPTQQVACPISFLSNTALAVGDTISVNLNTLYFAYFFGYVKDNTTNNVAFQADYTPTAVPSSYPLQTYTSSTYGSTWTTASTPLPLSSTTLSNIIYSCTSQDGQSPSFSYPTFPIYNGTYLTYASASASASTQSKNAIAIGNNAGAQQVVGWQSTPSNTSCSFSAMSANGQYQLVATTSSNTYYVTSNGNTPAPTWTSGTVGTTRICAVSSIGQNMILFGSTSSSYSTTYGQSWTTTTSPWSANGSVSSGVTSSTLQYMLVTSAGTGATAGVYLSYNGQTNTYSFLKVDGQGGLPAMNTSVTTVYGSNITAISGNGNVALVCTIGYNATTASGVGSNIYYTTNILAASVNGTFPTWSALASATSASGLVNLTSTTIGTLAWNAVAISSNGNYILAGATAVPSGKSTTSSTPSYIYLSSNGASGTPTFTALSNLPSLQWSGFTISATGQYMYAAASNFAVSTPQLYYSSTFGVSWTQIIYPTNVQPNLVSNVYLSLSQDGQYLLLASSGIPAIYNGTLGNNVAIGTNAGLNNQAANTISIGTNAGQTNAPGFAVAIGNAAGAQTDLFTTYSAPITNTVPSGGYIIPTLSLNGQTIIMGSYQTGNNITYSTDGGVTFTTSSSGIGIAYVAYTFISANGKYVLTSGTGGSGTLWYCNTFPTTISFPYSSASVWTNVGGSISASTSFQWLLKSPGWQGVDPQLQPMWSYFPNPDAAAAPTWVSITTANGIPTLNNAASFGVQQFSLSGNGQYSIITLYNTPSYSYLYYSNNSNSITTTGLGWVPIYPSSTNNLPSLVPNNSSAGPPAWGACAVSNTGNYILVASGIYNTSNVTYNSQGYAYLCTNNSSVTGVGLSANVSSLVFTQITFVGLAYWSSAFISLSGQYMLLCSTRYISGTSWEVTIYVSINYGITWNLLQNITITSNYYTRPGMSYDGTKIVNTSQSLIYVFTLQNNTSANMVAIGTQAAFFNQGLNSIAIGYQAGATFQNAVSSYGSIAIGYQAGILSQGYNAIAIGYQAGSYSATIGQPANTFMISTASIRSSAYGQVSSGALMYATTGELYYRSASKTFVIDHPTQSDAYLVHACLEGPEAGVYYRGEGVIAPMTESVTIILPSYSNALATTYTIHITGKIGKDDISIHSYRTTRVVNGAFMVYGPPGAFFWHAYGRRHTIITEPRKENVMLCGDGPYRYIADL